MSDLEKLFFEISRLEVSEQESYCKIIRQVYDLNTLWSETNKQIRNDLHEIAEMGLFTKKILGSHAKYIMINSKNGLLAVDPEDYGVGFELRMKGEYGIEELKNIRKYININSRILIVGAHIGSLAIPLAKICRKLVAIEANPDTYKLLELNLTINNIANCEFFNVAANDKSEKLKFLLSRANSGGSKRKPKIDSYMYSYDNPIELTIDAVSLDDHLKEHAFDLILMDIEGSEYFALKGMQSILAKTSILVMEFVPHHIRQVSGIDVEEFIELLKSFKRFTLPSKGITVIDKNFDIVLKYMYDNNISEDGIIFEKE